ncbi:MAG: hypothetical protein Kow0042_28970 [Calditrichia bacterium]
MAISILGPLNEIINKTTGEIIDNEVTKKIAGVINTVVNSSFDVLEDTLKQIRDLTKEEESK